MINQILKRELQKATVKPNANEKCQSGIVGEACLNTVYTLTDAREQTDNTLIYLFATIPYILFLSFSP